MAFARTARLLVPLTTCAVLATVTAAVGNAAPAVRPFDPSGTQLLTSATSGFPDVAKLSAVTPAGLVFSDSTGTWLKPAGGGSQQQLAGPGSRVSAAAGPMIWLVDAAGTKSWRNTSTGTHGDIPRAWRAPSSTGGLYQLLSPSGAIHIVNNNAINDKITDIGAVGSWAATGDQLVSGPSGVLEIGRQSNGSLAMTYLTYAGQRRVPDLTGIPAQSSVTCVTVTATYAGCIDNTAKAAIAISMSGGAPTYAPTGGVSISSGPAVTTSTLAWAETAGSHDLLHSIPLGGGTESILGAPALATASGVLPNGGLFYVSTAGDSVSDTGAIGTVADANGSPVVYRADPPLPLTVSELGIGPGRVAWADDSSQNYPVWSRTDGDPGAVVLGNQQAITTAPTADGLFVSGSRTAFDTASGFPAIADSTGTTVLGQPGTVVGLSGTRVMFLRTVGRHYAIYDMITTRFTDLTDTYPSITRNARPALWGNYVTFAKDDGSIWRVDLTKSAGPVNISPAQPAGRTVVSGSVWESGERMAWSLVMTDGTSNYPVDQYIDASSGNPATDAPAGSAVAGTSDAGVMLISGGLNTLQSWDGQNTMPLSGRSAVSDGTRVAWIGTDGLPRIAPVSFPLTDQPRLLTPVNTTTGLDLNGNWSLRVPTSAPLTSCSVSFTSGNGTTVDTAPCDSTAAALGEVQVNWTPPDSIDFGNYTWRLDAASADGPVLGADGSSAPTKGTVTLALSVTGVSPNSVPQGAVDYRVVVYGNRFDNRATVGFGGSITVTRVVVNSSHQLTATIKVTPTATLGLRTVTVSDRGSPDGLLRNSFTVTAA